MVPLNYFGSSKPETARFQCLERLRSRWVLLIIWMHGWLLVSMNFGQGVWCICWFLPRRLHLATCWLYLRRFLFFCRISAFFSQAALFIFCFFCCQHQLGYWNFCHLQSQTACPLCHVFDFLFTVAYIKFVNLCDDVDDNIANDILVIAIRQAFLLLFYYYLIQMKWHWIPFNFTVFLL